MLPSRIIRGIKGVKAKRPMPIATASAVTPTPMTSPVESTTPADSKCSDLTGVELKLFSP